MKKTIWENVDLLRREWAWSAIRSSIQEKLRERVQKVKMRLNWCHKNLD